jgi:hypothetical protein
MIPEAYFISAKIRNVHQKQASVTTDHEAKYIREPRYEKWLKEMFLESNLYRVLRGQIIYKLSLCSSVTSSVSVMLSHTVGTFSFCLATPRAK